MKIAKLPLYDTLFNRLRKSAKHQTTAKVNTVDKKAIERIRAGIRRRVAAHNKLALSVGTCRVPPRVLVSTHPKKINTVIISLSGA